MQSGVVYLIGAGPGDPKLITLRGMELLSTAEVIVYDRLVHPTLLKYARPDTEQIYVGKARDHHAIPQPEINALLVERAKQGKMVARLKGGDPFVFGRGGEEAEACQAAGIPCEIVPGVTSAIAVPAYAGIPVTHRDLASSFAVITGHVRTATGESGKRDPGAAEKQRDWQRIANSADTLLFLMGVENLPEIAARLQEFGRSQDTPVALVQWGTWTRQRVVTGTLANIVEAVKDAHLGPPAVCIIGEVVRLRETLRWFDDLTARPLFGKRILVTRSREQTGVFADLLRVQGAEPVQFPVIKIVPRTANPDLDAALRTLGEYAWMVFTSANAVAAVAHRLEALQLDSRAFAHTRIAAIGDATADSIWQHFRLRADFVPTESVADSLISEWPDTELTDKRILFPRAAEGREILPEHLRRLGASVDLIAVYDNMPDTESGAEIRALLERNELDALTFTSSSTVRNFAQAVAGEDTSRLPALIGNTPIVAIGPVTADTARALGLTPRVASEHTIPGLIAELEILFHSKADPPRQ